MQINYEPNLNHKTDKQLRNEAMDQLLKSGAIERHSQKVAIRRGCPSHGSCFCSGVCQEIIGWRDKVPGEN